MERQRNTMELQDTIDDICGMICSDLCKYPSTILDQETLENEICANCRIRERVGRMAAGLCEPVEPETEQDRRFAAFWEAYPKKVGKKVARKAWDKLAPSEELTDAILAGVAAYQETDQWKRGFIYDPATFLNQERWTDELPPEPTRPSKRKALERGYQQHEVDEEALNRLLTDLDEDT